jgi:hypothetical protein
MHSSGKVSDLYKEQCLSHNVWVMFLPWRMFWCDALHVRCNDWQRSVPHCRRLFASFGAGVQMCVCNGQLLSFAHWHHNALGSPTLYCSRLCTIIALMHTHTPLCPARVYSAVSAQRCGAQGGGLRLSLLSGPDWLHTGGRARLAHCLQVTLLADMPARHAAMLVVHGRRAPLCSSELLWDTSFIVSECGHLSWECCAQPAVAQCACRAR